MSEKSMKIADFAELIGCTPKTIYLLIEKEELITGKDRLNGREITVIISNDEQIEDLQKRYGKLPVINSDYEDILTVNVNGEQVNNLQSQQSQESLTTVIERLITSNEQVNNQLKTVYEELAVERSKKLLLEDKAGREGLYIKEINELKTVNEGLMKVNNNSKQWFIISLSIVVIFFVIVLSVVVINLHQPSIIPTEEPTIIEQPAPVQPQKKK